MRQNGAARVVRRDTEVKLAAREASTARNRATTTDNIGVCTQNVANRVSVEANTTRTGYLKIVVAEEVAAERTAWQFKAQAVSNVFPVPG